MKVRTARQDDLAGLLTLYNQLNPDDAPLDPTRASTTLARMLATSGMTIFVLEDSSRVAATCTLVVIENLTRNAQPYALIENVVTDADHRNRGYGRAVIEAALNTAWTAGCYKVMLMTGSKRPETLRFYTGIGFQQNKTGFQIRQA